MAELREYSPAEAVLIRRNRRWFVHVLSLALLFAQLGMVVHASSHLKSDPHATPTQSSSAASAPPSRRCRTWWAARPPSFSQSSVSHDRAPECAAIASVPHRAFSGVPFPRSSFLLLNNK